MLSLCQDTREGSLSVPLAANVVHHEIGPAENAPGDLLQTFVADVEGYTAGLGWNWTIWTSERESSSGTLVEGRQGSRDFEVLKYVEVQALHYTVDSTKDTCLAVGSVFVCNTGIQAIWSIDS